MEPKAKPVKVVAPPPVSVREEARAYARGLEGEAAIVFNDVFKRQQESTTVKKAFTAAKVAAAKVKPPIEPVQ